MADDHVGTGIDGRLRDGAFVRRERGGRVHDALVQGDDHELRRPRAPRECRPHASPASCVGRGQRRARRDRCDPSAVSTRTKAQPARVGVAHASSRTHAVVAQQRDAAGRRLRRDSGRRRAPRDSRRRRSARCPRASSAADGVGDALGAAIGDVIAGQRDRVKARAPQRRHVVGIRARRGDVALQAAARGACAAPRRGRSRRRRARRQRGDAVEPVVGLRHVEYQVTGRRAGRRRSWRRAWRAN